MMNAEHVTMQMTMQNATSRFSTRNALYNALSAAARRTGESWPRGGDCGVQHGVQHDGVRRRGVPQGRVRRSVVSVMLAACVSFGTVGCSLDRLVRTDDPEQPSAVDPDKVRSYTGAVSVYYGAISALLEGVSDASRFSGLLTDELTHVPGSANSPIDDRFDLDNRGLHMDKTYRNLQTARSRAAQAVELLHRYGTAASNPLLGHAYAIQGYTIVLLAELFCSGIPLTETPFENGITYTRGFTTTELLERATVLFDSAYFYGQDSLPIATLAQVGKGRALLGLGRYDEAATAVASVPTSAQYVLRFIVGQSGRPFWTNSPNDRNAYRILNAEGGNGIQWIAGSASSQDSRLPVVRGTHVQQGKYLSGNISFIAADGIQARMIEAEAQLQPANAPSGPWLATLNTARATRGLADTTDPGTADARIDLLFRERGFWFYLNGQRLGDLRRLVRQYGRPVPLVYPSGPYPGENFYRPLYGSEVVFVTPPEEADLNPLYSGCLSRGV
jgi:hypothetical protein